MSASLTTFNKEFKKECRTLGQDLLGQAEREDVQAETCDDVVAKISAGASRIQSLR